MKTTRVLFCILIAFSGLLCSCSTSDCFVSSNSSTIKSEAFIKSLLTRSSDNEYRLTNEDLESYVKFKALASQQKDFRVNSVIPFPDNESPALYAINYDGYWELLSGDKRVTPVVASGEGAFSLEMDNKGLLAWAACLGEEILSLQDTDYLSETQTECIRFWKLISADYDLIRKYELSMRSGPDTLNHPVPGHYELACVEESETIISSINHLISTKWGQLAPYNIYCPLDYTANYSRCYAGCAPVAAGQIIYYYHYAGDNSPAVYDSAYCNTFQHPHTVWSQMNQYNKASSNWYKFQTADSSKMAAIMLANIGKGIPVRYGRTNSTTIDSLRQLMAVMLDEYNLESHFDYITSPSFTGLSAYDYLYELLIAGYPSILSAFYNSISGHVFILDRYKNSYKTYTYYYSFIPDTMLPDDPYEYEEVEYVEVMPVQRYFGMNWGLDGLNDDSWFIDSGDWQFNTVHLNYRREMLTFLNDGSYPPGEGFEAQSIIPISYNTAE